MGHSCVFLATRLIITGYKVEMDESSSNHYLHNSIQRRNLRTCELKLALSIREIIDNFANWLADNAKSFYLLPDSLELALSIGLVIYFATKFVQQA